MSIRYVNEWPRVIGMTVNPTAEQCREAGYELTANKPQDVIDAEDAAVEKAAAEQAAHDLLVSALRTQYKQYINLFCVTAGVEVVDKFEDATTIVAEIEKANAANDMAKALRLTQIAMAVQNLITELRRKDGDDAWERIV
jgi:hypothetical protein